MVEEEEGEEEEEEVVVVVKVEVEGLAAHLGWRESGKDRDLIDLGEDEEEVEKEVVVLEEEELAKTQRPQA